MIDENGLVRNWTGILIKFSAMVKLNQSKEKSGGSLLKRPVIGSSPVVRSWSRGRPITYKKILHYPCTVGNDKEDFNFSLLY